MAKAARNKASEMHRPMAVLPWTRSDMLRRNTIDLSNSLSVTCIITNCGGVLHMPGNRWVTRARSRSPSKIAWRAALRMLQAPAARLLWRNIGGREHLRQGRLERIPTLEFVCSRHVARLIDRFTFCRRSGESNRNCSAPEYNRTSHRAHFLATLSRVSGAPDSL